MNGSADDDAVSIAEMTHDALAMNRALLESNWPEARFRAGLLLHQATATGDADLIGALLVLNRKLGTPGGPPGPGCESAMLAVSDLLSKRRT